MYKEKSARVLTELRPFFMHQISRLIAKAKHFNVSEKLKSLILRTPLIIRFFCKMFNTGQTDNVRNPQKKPCKIIFLQMFLFYYL